MERQKIKSFFAIIMLLIMFGSIPYFWIYFRGEDLNTNDLFAISLGVLAFFWMIFWLQTKHAPKHSLFIPYSPIFIVMGGGLLLSNFQIVSGYNIMNLFIFFLCGYIYSLCVNGLYNLFFKSKSGFKKVGS